MPDAEIHPLADRERGYWIGCRSAYAFATIVVVSIAWTGLCKFDLIWPALFR